MSDPTASFPVLALSSMTSPRSGLRERVEAAAAAGFTGVGLRPGDVDRALASGETRNGIRNLLADHAMQVSELDVLVGWGQDGIAGVKARQQEERLLQAADDLGGVHHLTVTGQLTGPWERSVELFAGVCDRAADHGLTIALEFLPWTEIPDAATALRMITDADRPNAGVLVDSWHHFRGAADDAQLLALPADRVIAVQLDDGLLDGRGPLLQQTFDRLLPGEGEFDLPHFLRLLAGHGVSAPLCVEVISPVLADLPVAETAARCAAATRQVWDRAFASSPNPRRAPGR